MPRSAARAPLRSLTGMEPKFQTSFIPKQALEETATGRRARGSASLLLILAAIMFLGAVASAVGVFLYGKLLTQQIDAKTADLERARKEFDPALIERLADLDERLKASQELLGNHLALSSLLELLESYTLKNVQFESFRYANAAPDKITLTLRGRARSFGAVAKQSDTFAIVPFIKDPLISNPNLDPQGNVTFDFTATLDPALLSYEASLKSAGSNPEPPVPLPLPSP